MALDLKFELFAHDLFCKIFFENDVTDKICDGRVHYADECMVDIQSHQQQIYDDCFYQAVVCRQYFFRRVFYGIFEENPDFYTSSYSDFCDYVHIIFNREDLFGDLDLFDYMLASCAFVADLCLFCYNIGNRNFIQIAHLCWALYFDRFSKEFYKKGGWWSFRKLALSYSLPFRFLTTHIEPRMPSSYMFVSLTRLHLALASFFDFWNSGIDAKRTFSKNWIEFRRSNSDVFQFVPRQFKKVHEEPQNAEQAENLLLHLIYLCHPIIYTASTADGKAESHSSEDLNEFLSDEEYGNYFSHDEWVTRLSALKNKELLEISEKNKIQIPKSEENLLQVCEAEEIFQPSEKDPLLQQISDAENLLQQLVERDKINRLLSEYEDLKELYDNNQKFTDGEKDLKHSEPEKNSLQHFERGKILKQLFETKNRILELYEKNQSQFSKKYDPPISEFQMNSHQDKDKVSLTPSNSETMLNICREIISLGAECCENYFTIKDEKSLSHCTNHQDSDVINIHRSSSQSLQIRKGISQSSEENGNSRPEHGKKGAIVADPENNFTLTEYQMKISPLNTYQEELLSSDNKKKSASNEQEWASSCDIHLNPENPIAENQNNSTYQNATLLSDKEVKSSSSKGNLPSFDSYLVSENPVIESNIQSNESIQLKKSKQSYELRAKSLSKKFPSKYEIYKTLFHPRKDTCIKHKEIEHVSFEETKENFKEWDTFHEFFKYERDLLSIVCEYRDHSPKEDQIMTNILSQTSFSSSAEDPISPNISHNQNKDFLNAQNDEVDPSLKKDDLIANVVSQISYSPPFEDKMKNLFLYSKSQDQDKDCLSVQNDEDHSLKEDEIIANVVCQTNYSPLVEDQKKDCSIFHGKNQKSVSAQNNEVAPHKIEKEKEAVPINNNQENFVLLIREPDQILNQIEGKQSTASVTADDKHASAVEVKIGNLLESRELMNISDQPNIKVNKRKEKKKKRKKKKRNISEKITQTVVAQTDYHTSEEKGKHSTKSSPTKKLTLPIENNLSHVVTDISSKDSNKIQIDTLRSFAQKAISNLVMAGTVAVILTDIQKNLKGIERDEKICSESYKDENKSFQDFKRIPFYEEKKRVFSNSENQKNVSQTLENVTSKLQNVHFEKKDTMKAFTQSNDIIKTLTPNQESAMKCEDASNSALKDENTFLSSTENSSLTLQLENTSLSVLNPDSNEAFSSIVNRARAILPDRKSVASSDKDQNLRCVSPESREKTFFASVDQNNTFPDTEYQKRKILETHIVKSETEAFGIMEIETKQLSNDYKNSYYQPIEYSLPKHELSSTIEKLKEFCSISNDSETSSLKIEDREKSLFLVKDRRSVCPIDDNPENFSPNPTKTRCPCTNNQLMTEQHLKTEEKTSFSLNKEKNSYLSVSIKEDVDENIAVGKSASSSSTKIKDPNCLITTTNIEERSFSPSHSDLLLSVSDAGKVESNQATEIEAFGSSPAENKDITDLVATDEEAISSAITYEDSSYLSCFSKELKTYSKSNGKTSRDFSISSTTPQQDQKISCVLSNKSPMISDDAMQSQNASFSSILQQEANNNDLDTFHGSKKIRNLDASEKTDSKENSSDINCPHSESQSKEVILNNKVQCIDFESSCSANAITLENTKKSNKCDSFLQTLMHNRNLNQDPTLQTIDEKTILINNILILGIKNKITYPTSIFKDTQS